MQETYCQSQGEQDPLEKGRAMHSSILFFFFLHSNILAWKIPWAKETGGLQSIGWQEADMTKELHNNNTV